MAGTEINIPTWENKEWQSTHQKSWCPSKIQKKIEREREYMRPCESNGCPCAAKKQERLVNYKNGDKK